MTKEPLAKDMDKFVLRMPDGMRDRIRAEADANNRSMNAEIVSLLEVALWDAERLRNRANEPRKDDLGVGTSAIAVIQTEIAKLSTMMETLVADMSDPDGEIGARLRHLRPRNDKPDE